MKAALTECYLVDKMVASMASMLGTKMVYPRAGLLGFVTVEQ